MPSSKLSKNTQFVLGLVLIFVVGCGITVYSGSMTGRWGLFSGLKEARSALKEIPMVIGDWEAQSENKMTSDEETMLRVQNGYINRSYRNVHTNEYVHLIIMVGPTGYVVVHTPEICFGGKDYSKEGDRVSVPISVLTDDGARDLEDSFWKVDFVNRSLDLHGRISFYYGVNIGDAWIASERPRQTFRTYRYIYRLQAQAHAEADRDTVKEFLEACLPTIHQHLRKCS